MAYSGGRGCGQWGRGRGTEFKYLTFIVIQFEFVSGHPIPNLNDAVLDGLDGTRFVRGVTGVKRQAELGVISIEVEP